MDEDEQFKMKFPDLNFDINALVNFQLGFEQLKLAIEYLLNQQKATDKTVDRMGKDVRSRTGLIDK